MSLIACSICKKRFLKSGIRNHIIATAQSESFRLLKNLLDVAKNKPYTFSSIVALRQAKHLSFYRKNLISGGKKILKL